jgi:hypothetical protein
MKIYQFSCLEGDKIDLHQANAILRHRPDIIIFESPAGKDPGLAYNKYRPENKPLHKVREYQKMLRRVAKKYPWVASDIEVYKNIETLWKQGHDIKLYHVDGPPELLQLNMDATAGQKWDPRPYRRGTHLSWWIYIYLRDKIMTTHIRKIFLKHKSENPTILIFLQKFHWINVKFQMTNPSKKELWRFYFGAFKNLTPKTLTEKMRRENKLMYKYWKKIGDF